VRYFVSLIYGFAIGVISILLHQTLPPFGVITSLLFTYFGIWWIGRHFGSRSYKWFAFIGWIAILIRASTFGAGEELLVQGDGVGSTLLLIGALTALGALAART
jgi:hypothetical protein